MGDKSLKSRLSDKEGLLGAGVIFLAGSIIAAVFNYLYHLFMGRLLGPFEYGVLGSLFAIIYFAGFATKSFNLLLSRYVSELKGNNKEMIGSFVKKILYDVMFYGGILLAVYVLFIPMITKYLNLTSTTGVLLVGVIGYLSIISSIIIGSFNGLQRFLTQNIIGSIMPVLKFTLAIILVTLGFGVNGALSAVLIGTLIPIIVGLFVIRPYFKIKVNHTIDKAKIRKYFIGTLSASIFPVIMITYDHVLVKHFFTSDVAGFYAAAGMIAKIIWFGSGFFVGALFPKIVEGISKKKDVTKLFRSVVIYTAVLASLGILAYFVIPTFIVRILYGSQYLSIAPLIGLFGVALGLFSVNQIFITYNLAREKFAMIWILFIGLLIEVGSIYLYHTTLVEVVKALFVANLFILIAFLIYNRKDLGALI